MEVRDIVSRVSRHFYDLVDEDANPLVVALALQDNSSVGLQHYAGEFAQLHEDLRQALKVRVDANYQGFNTSVGVYHSAVAALKSGHADIHDARQQLTDVHNQLVKRKPMLKDLQHKSALFKRKLEILADLEEIQSVPPRYEDCVARKQFREAQSLLSYALEKINSRDLLRQPAIRPLYSYFTTQQSQLYSRVLDEMRAHIYMSSPYAQRRINGDSDDYNAFIRRLPELPRAQIDSQESPESNSFSYLVLLGETLAALHRLSDGLDELVKRAPEDLNQLAQRITAGVVVELKLSPESLKKAVNNGGTLIDRFKFVDQSALAALATSLYAHLSAVLEGYRAIIEISTQLGVHRSLSSVYGAVISEARSLLLSYIGGEDAPMMPMRPRATSEANSISRISRSRLGGSVFEFGDGDEDSRGLRDFDALREALKRSVPGLLTDDPHHLFADTNQQQHMEVVAPAHILNIRPLLEPSVSFFARAGEIVKGDAAEREFSVFLDTFLQQSFVPRLNQAFDNAIESICNDETALDESANWASRSQLPLMECVEQFADTVGILCQLLDMGTSFREDYAVILVGLLYKISRFFDFRARAQLGGDRRAGKIWSLASSPQMSRVLSSRYAGKADQRAEFAEYYAQRLPPGASKPTIALGDLLDIATYTQATLLVTSVRWLALVLRKMRRVTPSLSSSSVEAPHRENSSVAIRRRWMLLDAPAMKEGAVPLQRTFAVLGGKPLSQYDENIAALDSIVQKTLATLRTDVFCRIVYYFDQMVIGRDFQSSRRREERDPVVDRLQREISLIAQVADASLISADRDFLLDGVAQFMNEMFILEAENIREMSESGQSQMLTNIFALQQMLTSIVSDPRDVDFSRATSFYELFRLGPSIILERVRIGETDMSIDDLKLLLALRHRKGSSAAAGTLTEHYAAVDEIFSGQNVSQDPTKQVTPPVMPLRTRKATSNASASVASVATASGQEQTQPRRRPDGSSVDGAGKETKQETSTAEARRAEEAKKQETARREAEAKILQKQRRDRKAQMEAEIKRRDEDRLQRAHEDAKMREAERVDLERQEAGRRASEQQRAAAQQVAEQRAAEQRAAEQRAAEQRAAEQRAAEQRAAEQRAAEQRAAEQRAAEQRAAEQRAAEQRAAEQRAAEQRAAEQRAAEQRAAEQRAAKQRAAEQRAAEQRAAEQRAEQEQAQAQAREFQQRREYERTVAETRKQQQQQREVEALQQNGLSAEVQEQQRAVQARREQSIRAQQARENEQAQRAVEEQRLREDANHAQAQAHARAQAQAQAQPNTSSHNLTAAPPAPQAARSPLLNHRMHPEQQQQQLQQQQQRQRQQQQQQQDMLPQPPLPPQHRQQSRSRSPSSRPHGPRGSSIPREAPQSPQNSLQTPVPLPRIRTRPSGASLRSQNMSPVSPGESPVTPTSPTSPGDETRQRTASERALEAAQRVRQRSLPQPTIRRTK